MASPLSERIGSLVGERARLDALLSGNIQWQALLIARAAATRGEAAAGDDVERLQAALSANAMFRAREALDAAIRELTEASAAATIEAEDARASLLEVVRPRPEARVRSHPPMLAHGADADDLTRIRGIDTTRAAGLAALGVGSFAEIASWTAADVARFAARLGLDTEISRGNWIEQAAVLASKAARGRVTAPPPQPAPIPVPPAPAPQLPAAADPVTIEPAAVRPATRAVEPSAVVVTLHRSTAPRAAEEAVPDAPADPSNDGVVVREAPTAPDRLTLVRGLSAEMADWLAAAGVRRFAEIAAWTAGDIACYGAEGGIAEAARKHGWIEQAAVLASGRTTHYARRVLAGEWDALVPRPHFDARPDSELRAKLIAASLLSAANAMMRLGPLPPPEPLASELENIVAEEQEPAASTQQAEADEGNAETGASIVFEPAARRQSPTIDSVRFRQPRLAEQIVPLRMAAPETAAASERAARSRESTLGSWSDPTGREDAAANPIDAEWAEIPDTGPTPTVAAEAEIETGAGWPIGQPGEAEIFIHHLDDAATNEPPAVQAGQQNGVPTGRHRPLFRRRQARIERTDDPGGATEEASVEIYTHGERPRVYASATTPTPATEQSAVDTSTVRRFLKVLTGR